MLKELLLTMLMTVNTAAAPLAQSPAQQPAAPEPERITVTGELKKLEQKNWLNLTNAQMLEDFDSLYQALDENYPYFDVAKRKTGVDIREEYQKTRKELESCKTDVDFFLITDNFVRKAQGVGHLSLFMPGWYESTAELYKQVDDGDNPRTHLLAEAYNNTLSAESYRKFGELFNPVYDRVMEYYAEEEQETPVNEPNVTTKIIQPDKTAYIKINSFDMLQYEQDKKTLFNFYKEVADYENLIFDISENGGGGMSYFSDLMCAPNIDKPIACDVYVIGKNGALNNKYLSIDEELKAGSLKPVSEFPNIPGFHREDLEDLDFFQKSQYGVEPLGKEKMFRGKIWMLVSENVYSSSEYAAMLSKHTGFATLVGRQTGGDGIGVDPIPVILPNSGLIVRYSPAYGVAPDGRGSEEYGTTPDILSPENETPLETCLRVIKNGK